MCCATGELSRGVAAGRPPLPLPPPCLQGEFYASALSSIYTFGPTFRAENSFTARHLAEFWMIEPEMAFCNLEDDMQCAEDYVRYCCQHLLDNCRYVRAGGTAGRQGGGKGGVS